MKKHSYKSFFIISSILLVFIIIFSFAIGRYYIDLKTLISNIFYKLIGNTSLIDSQVNTVLFNIRLPRILMGILVGAGLSVCGATMQSIFQNPMVSLDVLGASNSAGFGAALGILLGLNKFGITLISFLFGVLSIFIVFSISNKIKRDKTISLVLTGMMVSSLFSSALSLLKLIADPTDQLPTIIYWIMGSLNGSSLKDFFFVFPIVIIGIFILFLFRFKLTILTIGDEEAFTLGVNPNQIRVICILITTFITSICVSVSGVIGWIGLVIPHIARIFLGDDMRRVIPGSAIIGSIFLLSVDILSRIITTSEVPLGILTSFVGAPFFIYLMSLEDNI